MNRIIGVAAALALAGWGPAAAAQDDAGGVQGSSYVEPSGSTAQPGENPSILTQVHQINLAEIQEGKLAEQNAMSKKVKAYGKTLVRDHEKADKEVQKEAKKLGVSLEGEQAADQGEISQLQGLTGADFDKQFVTDEVAGHQKAISMVKDALPQTTNSGEKRVLDHIVPVLKKHLKMAEKLQHEMGQSASAD
ncbi:MAG TPA: DUF4142 domain-containing protein [Myxococcales bacterium]|nr:DUF4142 domain-containing protein [Myxococcales bacterium]